MTKPVSWSGSAYNPVPHSENEIHGDEIANAYGFRGGLVPGVVVSAYLLHPAAVAWGRDWAERGAAHVVVHSPVYDGEPFDVELSAATDDAYEAKLVDERGVHCASASASLPASAPVPPRPRHDPRLDRDEERPLASREVMEHLRGRGLRALPARWSEGAEIVQYLRDASEMAPLFRDAGVASPAYVLGLTNWMLAGNVRMSPWLHLQTDSQHYRAIEPGTEMYVEGAIVDLFDKKGHEFVDADIAVYRRADDAAMASVRLRAIYKLRPASEPS